MRLFEFEPNSSSTLEGTLLTILQFLKAKNKNADGEVKVPFHSVAKLMNNAGFDFTYEELHDLNQEVPTIGNIITDFDDEMITLGIGGADEEDDFDDLEPSDFEMGNDELVDPMNPEDPMGGDPMGMDPMGGDPMDVPGIPQPTGGGGGSRGSREKFNQVGQMAQRAVNRRF